MAASRAKSAWWRNAPAWLRTCLEGLQVDAGRMAANVPEPDDAAVASAAALVDAALDDREPYPPYGERYPPS